MEIRLVLEEVEMAPLLVLGVMHRTFGLFALRTQKQGPSFEVDMDIESSCALVEVRARNVPRVMKPKGHREQFKVHFLRHLVSHFVRYVT